MPIITCSTRLREKIGLLHILGCPAAADDQNRLCDMLMYNAYEDNHASDDEYFADLTGPRAHVACVPDEPEGKDIDVQ